MDVEILNVNEPKDGLSKPAEQLKEYNPLNQWLIWSIQKNAWWGPVQRGYVGLIKNAGLYSFEEAQEIVAEANKFCIDKPNEAMIKFYV